MDKKEDIKLAPFSASDFDRLISWVKNERELVQFAGPVFRFPLTREQLEDNLADTRRHAFTIVLENTNKVIGYAEVYHTDASHSRLCRILIGDIHTRGKGYGKKITAKLLAWSFDHLHTDFVDLNVYSFNTAAIKTYESIGFKQIAINESVVIVDHEEWISYKMRITCEQFYNTEKGSADTTLGC